LKYLIFILILTTKVYSQISPGDLTNAHAKFEGISNCTKCHVLGEKVNVSKCLDCHTEIKDNISSGRGYHSSSDVKGKNCWSCHSEHNGRNFRIINFNKDKFDHNKSGFQLVGQHAKEKCESCHKQAFIKNSKVKSRKNTYLGLDSKCNSCHEDYHQGTLNSDCSTCHNNEKFKPAPKFNHDNAAFKLSGAHLKVDCIKCHVQEKKNGKDYRRYKGVAFNSCSNCHKDVHQGKFGNDCKTCHSTNSFTNINQSAFNHDKTNYPLVGKHKGVTCQSCHKNDLNSKPKHEKCIDCHKDFHKGDFTKNGIIQDCKNCHNEKGFIPSSFTLEAHNKGRFSLTGSHLAVPCRNCHFQNNELHFKDLGIKCIDCHKNVHGTEIKTKFMPDNDCSVCHQTTGWNTIIFEHSKTDFALSGKHAKVGCNKCHVKDKNYLFVSLKTNCDYCHKDIHFDQFKENDSTNCARCHTFDNWKPVKFEHSKTRFSLEGAHSKLECISCHKKIELNSNTFIKYKLEDFRCAACHH